MTLEELQALILSGVWRGRDAGGEGNDRAAS